MSERLYFKDIRNKLISDNLIGVNEDIRLFRSIEYFSKDYPIYINIYELLCCDSNYLGEVSGADKSITIEEFCSRYKSRENWFFESLSYEKVQHLSFKNFNGIYYISEFHHPSSLIFSINPNNYNGISISDEKLYPFYIEQQDYDSYFGQYFNNTTSLVEPLRCLEFISMFIDEINKKYREKENYRLPSINHDIKSKIKAIIIDREITNVHFKLIMESKKDSGLDKPYTSLVEYVLAEYYLYSNKTVIRDLSKYIANFFKYHTGCKQQKTEIKKVLKDSDINTVFKVNNINIGSRLYTGKKTHALADIICEHHNIKIKDTTSKKK
ncbi:hypothetical protein [Francisella sp. LA112445]|uniref:hypothetical protein n=1 Tax=Francisella sp. LA112445 TaxID=1395624 RepID=UPI001788B1C9|nr:hypothetical protein [Francisella sp. LA112445]QIW10595.1 hypothetical protein FIP56_07725 [Francisella sp. LA112445]